MQAIGATTKNALNPDTGSYGSGDSYAIDKSGNRYDVEIRNGVTYKKGTNDRPDVGDTVQTAGGIFQMGKNGGVKVDSHNRKVYDLPDRDRDAGYAVDTSGTGGFLGVTAADLGRIFKIYNGQPLDESDQAVINENKQTTEERIEYVNTHNMAGIPNSWSLPQLDLKNVGSWLVLVVALVAIPFVAQILTGLGGSIKAMMPKGE